MNIRYLFQLFHRLLQELHHRHPHHQLGSALPLPSPPPPPSALLLHPSPLPPHRSLPLLLFLQMLLSLPRPLFPFLLHPLSPPLTSPTHFLPLWLFLPTPPPLPALSSPGPPWPPSPPSPQAPLTFPSDTLSPSPRPHSVTSWEDDWSTKDDDLLLSLKCNERLRPSWRYITTKMQRPESQIRARWAELLELQRLATS